ncbi:hypothetical protein ABPG77_005501 [Micractinium sp. CCAP 211/92]
MFFTDLGGGSRARTLPRPLLIGLLLLCLFFAFSRDRGTPRTGSVARGSLRTGKLQEGVKDKIIYDLSIDNERLSRELLQLKQYVLDVRRAARGCGCNLNDAVLTLFPELHDRITEADVATAAADAAPHEGAAGGTSGTGGSAAAALAGSGGSAGGPGSIAGLAAGGALAAGARRQAAAAAGDGAEADRRSEPVQPLNTG